MSNNSETNQNICALCLEVTQNRGGKPIVNPGCCGKWFHQRCLDELIKKNIDLCPCCRAPLPKSQPNTTPNNVTFNLNPQNIQQQQQIAPPIIQQQQQQIAPPFIQQQQQQQVPQRRRSSSNNSSSWNVFSNFFGSSNSNIQQQSYPDLTHISFSGNTNNTDQHNLTEDPLPAVTNNNNNNNNNNNEDITNENITNNVDGKVAIKLDSTPEYPIIGTTRYDSFHAIASISIKEDPSIFSERKGMDIVCVLDNSGSMSGAKFTYLKHAVRFIQSQLTENDRLSIITFNSYPTGVHGLLRMNSNNKNQSENLLNNLRAGGGTNIYSGMKLGYDTLKNRTTTNTISCMFLLTDGVDGSRLNEKKQLAANMKAEGIGLFIFAFGADHDATHLNAIASAGESSYIYVESSDEVIDAFGGALGSQQGLAAKNIQLNLNTLSDGIVIDEVNAGEYKVNIAAGSKQANVTFSNLFVGEKRDILVRLNVPQVTTNNNIPQYPLFECSASYTPIGKDNENITHHTTEEENNWCTVERHVGEYKHDIKTRHIDVDAHIYRLKITELLKQALDMGDNDIETARKLLTKELKNIEDNSISYQNKHTITTQLYNDLKVAIDSMQSREHYSSRGGKSMITETYSSNMQQRSCYSKSATKNAYQSTSSMGMQEKSKSYKKSFY